MSLPASASWQQRKARDARQRRSASPQARCCSGQVLFGIVVLAIVGVIVLRSGNDPGVGVSSSELVLPRPAEPHSVRPPTHQGNSVRLPTLLVSRSGACTTRGGRRWYPLFACAGAIGMADLLNTFCHIHTPLLISTIRALLGWSIGLLVGVVVYYLLRLVLPADDQTGQGSLNAPLSDREYGSVNNFAYAQPDFAASEPQAIPDERGVSLSR